MTLPAALLSRVEDAGLNASAPPGQWWIDGWLVRTLPGKARRARCVNALMPGALPLDERIAAAEAACARTGVPLIFRITPFTQPADLPAALQARGFAPVDPTRVLVATTLPAEAPPPVPAGLRLEPLDTLLERCPEMRAIWEATSGTEPWTGSLIWSWVLAVDLTGSLSGEESDLLAKRSMLGVFFSSFAGSFSSR